MRVALLSNFWYLRGGLEKVMLSDAAGLEGRGHAVAPFASAHPLNDPTPWATFFSPNVDHAGLGQDMTVFQRAVAATRLVHNAPAVASFERFLSAFEPDLVHQHGICRQLSPSVLARAHARGIPTVLTLHDYSYRCPRGVLSRPGAPVCLAVSCAGHRYDRAVRFRCVHGSRAASAVGAIELMVNRALRRFERSVDLFLVPSAYAADRMREAGLPGSRLLVIPNALDVGSADVAPLGNEIVAYGRLVDYKGFELIVEAARLLPEVRFVIGGDGPARASLEEAARELRNLEFVGAVRDASLTALLRRARAVVVPSLVPETFGMVVLEAWGEGRPVVVTDHGALPELVDDGRTGVVVEAASTPLAEAISRLAANQELAERLGQMGRRELESTYSMETHLDALEALYRRLAA